MPVRFPQISIHCTGFIKTTKNVSGRSRDLSTSYTLFVSDISTEIFNDVAEPPSQASCAGQVFAVSWRPALYRVPVCQTGAGGRKDIS